MKMSGRVLTATLFAVSAAGYAEIGSAGPHGVAGGFQGMSSGRFAFGGAGIARNAIIGTGTVGSQRNAIIGTGTLGSQRNAIIGTGTLGSQRDAIIGTGTLGSQRSAIIGTGTLGSQRSAIIGTGTQGKLDLRVDPAFVAKFATE